MESDNAQNIMPADFYNFRVNYNLKKKITISIKGSHIDMPEKVSLLINLLIKNYFFSLKSR